MLTFAGRINKGETWRYLMGFCGDDGKLVSLGCSGCAEAYLSSLTAERFTEFMSWGYEGRGSELTAAYMLRHSTDAVRARRHAKAFAREVIDHLPDEWTMTSDEVLAWLKKKEGNEV